MGLALDSSHERFEHSTSIMRRGTTSGKSQQLNSHGEERQVESAQQLNSHGEVRQVESAQQLNSHGEVRQVESAQQLNSYGEDGDFTLLITSI